jgi:hypothetical protein
MKLNLSDKEIKLIDHLKFIFSYVFQTLLFLFLFTLLAQQFYPEYINSHININWFMLVVIIFGALSIIFPPEDIIKKESKTKPYDYLLILVLGLVGGFIIFLKLNSLGWISYIIASLGGLIIILLSYLILVDKDDKNEF